MIWPDPFVHACEGSIFGPHSQAMICPGLGRHWCFHKTFRPGLVALELELMGCIWSGVKQRFAVEVALRLQLGLVAWRFVSSMGAYSSAELVSKVNT